ncbi:hypothetical protein TREMEDRAFT_65251 [Tremella mesenterica DSM 1558]|uniref:uncharacterized protein n=1 Tax=Tremella mesenterica (strain ATCC 24925 / CBS 8224 / DSM 1558 / NBRC 9311 / NRRL Y-6157 / RJB 2259-6 / UBC 559-6) TaxID=578456 RepID=UPI00032C32E5|nr:uncharacterized protein TREMEDRAFT_65251 [Tremella mesenterica DSM 1558]EIW66844.1 hypothetical protein TREMEDRAFT_65251 [Tremella mesenterica DSM 1558]
MYGPKVLERYMSTSTSDREPPHIYALANMVSHAILSGCSDQTVLFSGQRHKVVETVLEALGNAETGMNHNSSRFATCLQLHISQDDNGKRSNRISMEIQTLLFEKSRVVAKSPDFTFHALREIPFFVGGSGSGFLIEKSRVDNRVFKGNGNGNEHENGIGNGNENGKIHPKEVVFQGQEISEFDSHSRGKNGNGQFRFEEFYRSLKILIGIDQADKILNLLIVIHLLNNLSEPEPGPKYHDGDIHLLNNLSEPKHQHDDDEKTRTSSSLEFETISGLLGIENKVLLRLLTYDSVVGKPINLWEEQGSKRKNAIVCQWYVEVFQWIVGECNRYLAQDDDGNHDYDEKISSSQQGAGGSSIRQGGKGIIRLLDVYGFEQFETNDLSQLLINWTNEQLQSTFINQVLDNVIVDHPSPPPPTETRSTNLGIFSTSSEKSNPDVDRHRPISLSSQTSSSKGVNQTSSTQINQTSTSTSTSSKPSISRQGLDNYRQQADIRKKHIIKLLRLMQDGDRLRQSPIDIKSSWSHYLKNFNSNPNHGHGHDHDHRRSINSGGNMNDKPPRSISNGGNINDKPQRHGENDVMVEHFAGKVNYDLVTCLSQNANNVPDEAMEVLKSSKVDLYVKIAMGSEQVDKKKSGKKVTVTSKHEKQLAELMRMINDTQVSFVKCIRVGNGNGDGEHVRETSVNVQNDLLKQLEETGLVQVTQVLSNTLPVVRDIAWVTSRFASLIPSTEEDDNDENLSVKQDQVEKRNRNQNQNQNLKLNQTRKEEQNENGNEKRNENETQKTVQDDDNCENENQARLLKRLFRSIEREPEMEMIKQGIDYVLDQSRGKISFSIECLQRLERSLSIMNSIVDDQHESCGGEDVDVDVDVDVSFENKEQVKKEGSDPLNEDQGLSFRGVNPDLDYDGEEEAEEKDSSFPTGRVVDNDMTFNFDQSFNQLQYQDPDPDPDPRHSTLFSSVHHTNLNEKTRNGHGSISIHKRHENQSGSIPTRHQDDPGSTIELETLHHTLSEKTEMVLELETINRRLLEERSRLSERLRVLVDRLSARSQVLVDLFEEESNEKDSVARGILHVNDGEKKGGNQQKIEETLIAQKDNVGENDHGQSRIPIGQKDDDNDDNVRRKDENVDADDDDDDDEEEEEDQWKKKNPPPEEQNPRQILLDKLEDSIHHFENNMTKLENLNVGQLMVDNRQLRQDSESQDSLIHQMRSELIESRSESDRIATTLNVSERRMQGMKEELQSIWRDKSNLTAKVGQLSIQLGSVTEDKVNLQIQLGAIMEENETLGIRLQALMEEKAKHNVNMSEEEGKVNWYKKENERLSKTVFMLKEESDERLKFKEKEKENELMVNKLRVVLEEKEKRERKDKEEKEELKRQKSRAEQRMIKLNDVMERFSIGYLMTDKMVSKDIAIWLCGDNESDSQTLGEINISGIESGTGNRPAAGFKVWEKLNEMVDRPLSSRSHIFPILAVLFHSSQRQGQSKAKELLSTATETFSRSLAGGIMSSYLGLKSTERQRMELTKLINFINSLREAGRDYGIGDDSFYRSVSELCLERCPDQGDQLHVRRALQSLIE